MTDEDDVQRVLDRLREAPKFNTHPVSEVLAVLVDDGTDPTADMLDALAASRIAPSRLCAKCFYVTTRSAYARKVAPA